jgi:hypothetical protein
MKWARAWMGMATWALAACATPPSPAAAPPPPTPDPRPAPTELRAAVGEPVEPARGPVHRGELPWWHDLPPGVYQFEGQRRVLAVGRSTDHHHVAEGFLKAKVTARLGVRKAAEPVAFAGTMPEPELSDLFITREHKFYALYQLPVPEAAQVEPPAAPLAIPVGLTGAGRHRVGRHVFEGDRHLYLECEVEGPVANPDWGRSRATAMLTP